jgi:hypothetical protein
MKDHLAVVGFIKRKNNPYSFSDIVEMPPATLKECAESTMGVMMHGKK